jgi:hypothetical protein
MLNVQNVNLKGGTIQQDNIFVDSSVKSVKELTGFEAIKGKENLVISNGKVVNMVSNNYGHLPNEKLFLPCEEQLINADIQYLTRSINKNDSSFAVDYILNDDSFNVAINGNIKDKIRPMLHIVNSYDGSAKTSGSFGFFREVCSNGLNIATTKVGFSVKHRNNIVEVVIPKLELLVKEFMSNEYYTLEKKFEVLANKQLNGINEVQAFVKKVCEETKVFKFEASDKNPLPSLNANVVIDNIINESLLLDVKPNMWLGFNAFNEILYNKFSKSFDVQREYDNTIFETVLQMAN